MKIIKSKNYTTKMSQNSVQPGSLEDTVQVYSSKTGRNINFNTIVFYDIITSYDKNERIDIVKVLDKNTHRDILKYIDESTLCRLVNNIQSKQNDFAYCK